MEEISNKYVNEALDYGWKIDRSKLVPPHNFECSKWQEDYTEIKYKGKRLLVPSYIGQDDIRLFGAKINDERIQLALSYGWNISGKPSEYHNLLPPPHFEIVTKNYAGHWDKRIYNNYILINIPNWYDDDNMLITGRKYYPETDIEYNRMIYQQGNEIY